MVGMGFFDRKVICAVCDGETGLNRYRMAEKQWICPSCFKKAKFNMHTQIRRMTVADVNNAIAKVNENKIELENFKATKIIGKLVEFDDNQKKWLVLSQVLNNRKKSVVYNYNDILDFELLEDGESVASGGLGRALVGGALFGGTGAIVGGITGKRKSKGVCNSLKIKVTMNDINNPTVYITFLDAKTKKDGFVYKGWMEHAQDCLSTFQIICDANKQNKINTAINGSAADELKKFKELLDDGVITEEEFNAKKMQLLS